MGAIEPPSPLLFGPNFANNLQPGEILSNGALINSNGPKNYISYGNFENNATTGWSLGTIGTLTNGLPTGAPTFGSGASGNLSLTVPSTSQLAGSYSLGYVSSAATTAGNMVASQAYTIDAEDQAKVLTVKFYYSVPVNGTVNMSGTSSNSYAWAIWDVTNSSWLSSAGNFNLTQLTGTGYCTGTVQTNSTTASIRLCIYNANATVAASTLYLDDFYVGPQTAPSGPAMTDWVAYTPTFVGMGTVTGISFRSRRNGSDLEVTGYFTTGTVTGTTATVSLGYNGGNANVTTSSIIGGSGNIVGSGAGQFSSTTNFSGLSVIAFAGVTTLSLGTQQSTQSGFTAQTGTALGTGGVYSFSASVAIQGWSSNSVQSSDTLQQVVAATMTGATATVTGSYSDVTWTTIVNDTTGSMGAINYTAPVTGFYDFTGAINVGATSLSAAGGFFVSLFNTTSSTTLRETQLLFDLNVPENESIGFNYQNIFLTSGTQAKIQIKTSGTVGTPVINSSATLNYLSVSRKSGPAVVQATESVSMRYTSTTGTAITSNAFTAIPFAVKDYDSHNAFVGSTGVYTTPNSGKFRVNASVGIFGGAYAAGSYQFGVVYHNGALHSYGPYFDTGATLSSDTVGASCTTTVNCLAGDTLQFYVFISSGVTGSPVLGSTAGLNHIEIERVGN